MLPEINKIVYATDLLEKGSKNAFKMAVAMAKAHRAQLYVLHVMDPVSPSVERILRDSMKEGEYDKYQELGVEHFKDELMQRIDDFCREGFADIEGVYPGGYPIAVVEDRANPDKAILKSAENYGADLIVMGTRTHGGLGQFVLGSTADKVVHHAKIPVMVYPL